MSLLFPLFVYKLKYSVHPAGLLGLIGNIEGEGRENIFHPHQTIVSTELSQHGSQDDTRGEEGRGGEDVGRSGKRGTDV